MPIRILLSVIAVGAVVWSTGFVRAAVATFRTGVPFYVAGHRQGAMPVGAAFGRVGAAFITAISILLAFMAVHAAAASWRSAYFD
jgi:hypothetical protein